MEYVIPDRDSISHRFKRRRHSYNQILCIENRLLYSKTPTEFVCVYDELNCEADKLSDN